MSQSTTYLHSHSGLERELRMPKHLVLVDERFYDMFSDSMTWPVRFKYRNVLYYKVPILSFVYKNGVFKNYYE